MATSNTTWDNISSTPTHPSLLPEKPIELTGEQSNVISREIAENELVIVKSFSGTGKTTLIREYCKEWQNKQFLYLVYNTAIAAESRNSFSRLSNVDIKTYHGLAFNYKYKNHLVKGYKPFDIKSILNIHSLFEASSTIKLYDAFVTSDKDYIDDSIIPIDLLRNYGIIPITDKRGNATAYKTPNGTVFSRLKDFPPINKIISYASKMYYITSNLSDDRLGISHDTYLKMYSLKNTKLRKYDIIVVDEGQDIFPVVWPIILRQQCGVLLVGDPYQSINEWKGAKDSLDTFSDKASNIYYLTHSFRFGPRIARWAQMVLKVCHSEKEDIVGVRDNPSDPGVYFTKFDTANYVYRLISKRKENYNETIQELKKSSSLPTTILCRTRAFVFHYAVECMKAGLSLSFIGSMRSYNFHLISSVNNFMRTDDPGNDSFLSNFTTFLDLKNYVQEIGDPEYSIICWIVEKYKDYDIDQLIVDIIKATVEQDRAEIVLSTIHRSKGMEWDNVFITGDFRDLLGDDAVPGEGPSINFTYEGNYQEFNLVYVAITRGISSVGIEKDSNLHNFLKVVEKEYGKNQLEIFSDI